MTRTTARAPLPGDSKLLLEAPLPDIASKASNATDTGGGGKLGAVEGYYIHSVAALAEVADLNAWTLAAFFRKSGALAECRPGQGIEGCFLISEAFAVYIWGDLARRLDGSLSAAARIAPRSLDLYGDMRNGATRRSLSLDPKRLGQPALGGEAAVIELYLWQLWQAFFPRFRAYVVKHDPNMRGPCAAFEARVKDLREALAGLSPA
jgi:hypothetical protein